MNHRNRWWAALIAAAVVGAAIAALAGSAGGVKAAPSRRDGAGRRRSRALQGDRQPARRSDGQRPLRLPDHDPGRMLRAGPDPGRVRHPAAARPPSQRRGRTIAISTRTAARRSTPTSRCSTAPGISRRRRASSTSRRSASTRPIRQRRRLGRRDVARRRVGARDRAGREHRPRHGEVERRRRHPQRDEVRRRSQPRGRALAELRRGGAVHGVDRPRSPAQAVREDEQAGHHAARLVGRPGCREYTCDGNAYFKAVNTPASDPYVTGVGGTDLIADGTSGKYQSESVWNESTIEGDAVAGGGGVSVLYTSPSYQGLVEHSRMKPEPSRRLVQRRHLPGRHRRMGRLVLPLRRNERGLAPGAAGIVAIADQLEHGRVGQINQGLYQTRGSRLLFHDVTTGNNSIPGPDSVPGSRLRDADPGLQRRAGVRPRHRSRNADCGHARAVHGDPRAAERQRLRQHRPVARRSTATAATCTTTSNRPYRTNAKGLLIGGPSSLQ